MAFCRELSRASSRIGLASCRLLDNRQLGLGKAMKGEEVGQGALDCFLVEKYKEKIGDLDVCDGFDALAIIVKYLGTFSWRFA